MDINYIKLTDNVEVTTLDELYHSGNKVYRGFEHPDNIKCIIQGCLVRNIDISVYDNIRSLWRVIWYRHCTVCNRCVLWQADTLEYPIDLVLNHQI